MDDCVAFETSACDLSTVYLNLCWLIFAGCIVDMVFVCVYVCVSVWLWCFFYFRFSHSDLQIAMIIFKLLCIFFLYRIQWKMKMSTKKKKRVVCVCVSNSKIEMKFYHMRQFRVVLIRFRGRFIRLYTICLWHCHYVRTFVDSYRFIYLHTHTLSAPIDTIHRSRRYSAFDMCVYFSITLSNSLSLASHSQTSNRFILLNAKQHVAGEWYFWYVS